MTPKNRRGTNIWPLRADEKQLAVEQLPSHPLLSWVLCLCSYLLAQTPCFRPVCSFPSESRTAASLCPCIKAVQEGCVCWRAPPRDWPCACRGVSSVTWFQQMAEASACLWQPLKAARGTKNLIKILFYWPQDILVSRMLSIISSVWRERLSCREKVWECKGDPFSAEVSVT